MPNPKGRPHTFPSASFQHAFSKNSSITNWLVYNGVAHQALGVRVWMSLKEGLQLKNGYGGCTLFKYKTIFAFNVANLAIHIHIFFSLSLCVIVLWYRVTSMSGFTANHWIGRKTKDPENSINCVDMVHFKLLKFSNPQWGFSV